MRNSDHRPAKVALVFGGSRGIGAAAVERLAADGYGVAFTYVSRADKANLLVAAVEAAGGQALAIQADSAHPEAIRQAVSQAVDRFGTLSVLVVNAGLLRMGAIDEVSLQDLDLMLNVNVRAVYLAIQAASPHLQDGARVITIGSNVAVRTGMPGASVYQLTKTAVAGLVKGVALDLAPRGITVNNIQPGPTNTDMNAGAIDMLAERSPLKRVAQPQEIAGLISYLARDEARYVTGSSITIDGGLTL
ncbi:SDR family NAD(P)-dependent oxidoreductase [Variovorax saccharolyticus]|uniref:SDR family NAD(P)-dependent oxidoreductase n=1 Tax=Variovorax saccharolyticus TaxID=3053516 RepID=UPI002575B64B|nr:SDR family oxidoreductase [Variovorax sp. J22R187]MDM0019490.1 SDR family oxidoreductase [Variovorax sp. J22R187]